MIDATTVSRRQELAAFLRVRRDTLQPQHVGLAEEPRRHVPGLRREEVAERAGISTTWYTWLEQGREINMSQDVLEKIGHALRMEAHEIQFMQRLRSDTAPLAHIVDPQVPDVLRGLVETHKAAPAYIATPRFDLLVWNSFLGEFFNYDAASEPLARNILYRLFFDRSRRKLYADWEDAARRTVAAFRHTYSMYLGDKHFEDLLRLMRADSNFERMWQMYEVAAPGLPPFLIRHDTIGLCELTTVQASLSIAPGCYLCVFECKRLS
ncbi:MAG: helix-turn-helix domain-containing protein [Candidatus Eremiobacteraeota bacterium]|nr:helix-turn-helix domain-containing protein [Candidatus Eremiobacteraeota bacterium]